MKYLFLILLSFFSLVTTAQNNPIFYGGPGDGWGKVSVQQTVNQAMFQGGMNDGWNVASYAQPANQTMFRGDTNDGWNVNNYAQPANLTMFKGDTNDGWNVNNYAQPANLTMFKGDTNDGWNVNNYAQPNNDFVYYGGQGDGWATNFLALSPLPLDLLSFTGHDQDGHHVLDWTTTNEVNTSYFNIEHSTRAQHFNEIGLVSAKGNSANEQDYQFINKEPIIGANYYRLKMVDNDQAFTYSNTILLMLSADKSSVLVYPNPTVSEINVSITSNNSQAAQVSLYDISGKLIYNGTHAQNKFSISIENFACGMYQLLITKGDERKLIKIQKR